MGTKITKQIVGYSVVTDKPESAVAELAGKNKQDHDAGVTAAPKLGLIENDSNVVQMHENIARPEFLMGATYKIKSPLNEHAMYITINDMVLNPGTSHEQRRPFEIFFNSKNMDQFQWVVALTRVMSAVFRKGGDVTFLVAELKAVFDPRGGYFKPGGVFMPSIVAEIGTIIEKHLKMIGLIKSERLSEAQQELILEKRAEIERRSAAAAHPAHESTTADDSHGTFPPDARVCAKCNTKALVRLDNCDTCLNCGASKCG